MIEPEANGDPLSLSVLFIDAIGDGPHQISTRLLRSGARLRFWRSELIQRGKVCAHAQATLGVRRETTRFTDVLMPEAPSPDSDRLAEWAPPAGFGAAVPVTLDHADRTLARPRSQQAGQVRSCGRATVRAVLWIRRRWQRSPTSPRLRVIWKREMISGSATVSMTTHFHATPDEMAAVGNRFILSEVHCRRCEGGYFDHELKLWSPDGALLATSEQVAAFRDYRTPYLPSRPSNGRLPSGRV